MLRWEGKIGPKGHCIWEDSQLLSLWTTSIHQNTPNPALKEAPFENVGKDLHKWPLKRQGKGKRIKGKRWKSVSNFLFQKISFHKVHMKTTELVQASSVAWGNNLDKHLPTSRSYTECQFIVLPYTVNMYKTLCTYKHTEDNIHLHNKC